jgi:AmmeMemoRadiSam system protein B
MKLRHRGLPSGWYPAGKAQTTRAIEELLSGMGEAESSLVAMAGVAPHAGWTFSGRIACRMLRCLPKDVETVVVVGGHLPSGGGLLAAYEEGYETPLGVISADLPLLEGLAARLSIREDRYADNTVEVQLPLLRHLLPGARALALRAAPSEEALRLGETLAELGHSLGKKLAVVGSTDLTHYGSSYGFSPRGSGSAAVSWVKDTNDRRLIDALLAFRLQEALELALAERSACSAGGAVAAARFAQCMGCAGGALLEHATSHDIYPSDSFVGYAALIYPGSG